MKNNLKLIYVNYIGQQSTGEYEYEFFFSCNPYDAINYNDNWKNEFAGLSSDMLPYEGTYSEIKHLKTIKKLSCAQDDMCFPFIYAIYGVIALCFEFIDGLEEYPEPFRFVLHYGDDYEDIVSKMSELDLAFEEN